MHDEALEVLPALLREAGIERPVLVGHSDGGSIALIHAAQHPVERLMLLAPHVFVEDVTVASIEEARVTFETTDLGERMGRYHRDAERTFRLWNDIWLAPEFRAWNIEDVLGGVTAPTLLIQGEHDQYGTLAQIDAIERGVRGPVQRAVLDCRHAPQLEAPDATLAAAVRFVVCHERPRAPLRRPVRAQLRRRATGSSTCRPTHGPRDRSNPSCWAPTGPSRAGSTPRSPSRWPPPAPRSRSCRTGSSRPGLSNATHVVGEAREGVLEAIATCRARGEGEWLWDVEIGPPGAAASADRDRRDRGPETAFRSPKAGSGASVPQAAWSFSAARETPMQARRAVIDWAQRHVDDRAVLSDIALAVTEAATNVVLHAYRDRAEPGR